MAEKSVKRVEYALNPMFHIPEETDEFYYSDEDINTDVDSVEENSLYDGFVGDYDDLDYSDSPGVPDIIGVVSQTVRTTAAGNQVVDVIIEVEDMDAASNYELRVTKR